MVPDESSWTQTGIIDLPSDLHDLWLGYLKQEVRGVRKVALSKLRQFTAALRAADSQLRDRWAHEFLRQKQEEGRDFPLRGPLFEDILFPLLATRYRDGDPQASIWLARLSRTLMRQRACWHALGSSSTWELWKETYRRNPNDEQARRGLVDVTASYMRHTLHELPSGVLFGMNGATRDECIALQDCVNELISLLREPERKAYGDLIASAEFHYQAYRDYLLDREKYGSYASFLATRVDA